MPYLYLQIFPISLALLRGIVVCCDLFWIHIDFLRKCFQKIWIFAWTCFFHITLPKPVKYLQASFPFLIDRRNVRCFKTWRRQGRFYWTIYTYIQKVSKYVRVALNNFGGNVRMLRSLIIIILSYGFLSEFPLFEFSEIKNISNFEFILNSNNARVIFIF